MIHHLEISDIPAIMYAAALVLAVSLLGPVLAVPMPTGQSPAAAGPDILASLEARSQGHAIYSFYDPGADTSTSTSPAAEKRDVLKRTDQCWGPNGAFRVSDARDLQFDLQRNNANKMFLVRQNRGWISFVMGEARVCIQNNYIFENTHISGWEAGWVIGYILGKCCPLSSWSVNTPFPNHVPSTIPFPVSLEETSWKKTRSVILLTPVVH